MPSIAVINFDQAKLAEVRKLLNPEQWTKAIYQALKRTGTSGRAKIVANVRDKLTVKASAIRDNIQNAVVKTDSGDPVLKLGISGRPIRADQYTGTRISRGSIVAQMTKDKPPLVIGQGRSFVGAAINSGTKLFFFRTNHAPSKGPYARLNKRTGKPLKRQALATPLGPNLFKIMGGDGGDPAFGNQQLQDLTAVFEKNLDSQIDRFTKTGNPEA